MTSKSKKTSSCTLIDARNSLVLFARKIAKEELDERIGT